MHYEINWSRLLTSWCLILGVAWLGLAVTAGHELWSSFLAVALIGAGTYLKGYTAGKTKPLNTLH